MLKTPPPNFGTLPKNPQRVAWGLVVKDLQDSLGIDFTTAWNQAKLQYPDDFAALTTPDPATIRLTPVPAIDPRMVTPASPENIAKMGVAHDVTDGEWAAALKGAKSITEPDFEGAMSGIVNYTAKSKGLNYPEAGTATALRHRNLSTFASNQKVARDLQQGKPVPGAGFVKTQKDNSPFANPMDGSTTFPNKTRTGLGAFSVGNQQELDPQKFLDTYNTPPLRKAVVKALASYLAFKNKTDEDTAERSIPDECPHMSKVFASYQADCQNAN